MKNDQVERKKRRSRVLIIILLLIMIIAAVLFVFRGDVKEWLKEMPVIGTVFEETEKQPVSTVNKEPDTEKMLEEISELKRAVSQKQARIDELEDEISVMQQREEAEPSTAEENTKNDRVQDVAQMYASMSPGDAAGIMAELEDEETVSILSVMKNDVAALILAEMPPEQAAEITRLLTNVQPLEGGETE